MFHSTMKIKLKYTNKDTFYNNNDKKPCMFKLIDAS